MRSLFWKLSGALLMVAVISVGLTAYLTNVNTESSFRQYISTGNMMVTTSIAGELGSYFDDHKSWDEFQSVIDTFTTSSTQRLIVADSDGTIVGDSQAQWLGEESEDIGLANGTPVESSGKVTGYLYILTSGMRGRGYMGGGSMQPAAAVTTPEDDFLDEVNDSLWKVGLITLAVALVLGLVLTRQIIRPVKTLISGVRHIARGELNHRINVRSRDEIGELAESFNSMASALEKTEQSRRQLTADIAHELRTPLTVIEGTVNGIIDDVFPSDEEHLSSILEQTSLLTRLINDLRDISRAESGQLELNLSATDITELVGRIVSDYRTQTGEKNISMTFTASPELPEIMADPFRIEQAVTNLIMNAIRHVPDNGIISVTAEERETGIEIAVIDNGEGILPEDLPHVFERFYRSGSSRSREKGGTGLGLAIVKRMIESHGGSVSVESSPGKGADFRIFLPFNNR
ncbi:MAG: HAMP domain-containing protein [Dehalococcoidales bacterium]|nr:HAMP domain-containing protein [Dehalococcoidales bacterium]